MRAVQLYCFASNGSHYLVSVQERVNGTKVSERETGDRFPTTLAGYKAANEFVLRKNREVVKRMREVPA